MQCFLWAPAAFKACVAALCRLWHWKCRQVHSPKVLSLCLWTESSDRSSDCSLPRDECLAWKNLNRVELLPGIVSRDHHYIHSAQPWQSSLPYSLIFAGTRGSASESGLMSQWRPWIGLTASRGSFSFSLPLSSAVPFFTSGPWRSLYLFLPLKFKLSARLKFQTLLKYADSDPSEIETFRRKSRLVGKLWKLDQFIFLLYFQGTNIILFPRNKYMYHSFLPETLQRNVVKF